MKVLAFFGLNEAPKSHGRSHQHITSYVLRVLRRHIASSPRSQIHSWVARHWLPHVVVDHYEGIATRNNNHECFRQKAEACEDMHGCGGRVRAARIEDDEAQRKQVVVVNDDRSPIPRILWRFCCCLCKGLGDAGPHSNNQRERIKKHLLWCLMLLKRYKTENVLCSSSGGEDKKTFWKWAWLFVEELSLLEPDVVSSCGIFHA